jgi:outer membrane protein OmpA-like peptidoglycan-associated protein
MTKKIILTALTALTFASTGWTAESDAGEHSKERIGLTSGAVVGGLAGGPLGLVVGAVVGGWLGDEFDIERRDRADFERRWHEAEATVASLNEAVIDSESRLRHATSTHRRETLAMRERIRDALDVQILFKTGASDLEEITSHRLERLAGLVADMDDLLVHIEGHADARGDAEFNAQLSAHRAATVRDILLRAGVPASQILVDALGEDDAAAAVEDIDGMALDRRVQLTLIPAGTNARVAQE